MAEHKLIDIDLLERYDGKIKDVIEEIDSQINDNKTYDYAPVITIEDAVPANLSDCKVKIELVQDLHGYDHPWVGGANKNKINIADKASSTSGDVTASCSNGVITLSGTATEQTTFTFPLGSDIVMSPSLYKIAYNNTAATSYIAVKFCNNGNVVHSWTPNVINRVISDWTAAEDETINEIKIEIANGYPTNMTLSIVVMDKNGTDTSFAPYENICPISGRTEVDVERVGKNLVGFGKNTTDKTAEYRPTGTQRLIFDVLGDNKIKCKTPTNNSNWNVGYIDVAVPPHQDITKFRFSADITEKTSGITTTPGFEIDRSKSSVGHIMIQIYLNNNYITPKDEYIILDNAMLYYTEDGSAIQFVPYAGKTYTILFKDGSGNPVTVYNAEGDVNTGSFTVTHGIVDMGTLSWTKIADGLYRAEQSGMKNTADNEIADMLCETYFPDMYSRLPNGSVALRYTNQIWVRDNTVADATELTTNLDGKKLCYPLGTPTTLQLDHQKIQLLQGTNIIYCSTGDISVTVNGVSGAIGAVQEQVNDHEERIEAVESGLNNKIMISNYPLNLVCLNDISVSFTNGDSITDVSSYIPSGYQLSFVMASPVNTSTISVTGCKIYNNTNVEIKCRTDFTGNTDFNIMLFVRKSS